MKNKWLRLLIPEGETGGNGSASAPAAEPASSPAPSSEPSPAASEPASSPEPMATPVAPRSPAISPDLAEKMGLPQNTKAIDVKPMHALGLTQPPRSAVKDLIEKENLKINRSPVYDPKAIAAKVAATTSPAVTPPATTPTPPAAPVAPAPTIPAAPATPPPGAVQKYKIGDREYTPEQMAAYIEGQNANRQQPPAIQPQQRQTPTDPMANMKPEERQAFIKQKETEWVNQTAPAIDLSQVGAITPEQADIIAGGGPEAMKVLNEIRQKDVAYSTLLARKTVAQEANPIFEKMERIIQQQAQTIAPILQREQEIATWETEALFVADHPDLVPHFEAARAVGNELVRQFPKWAQTVTRKQFVDAVAEQTRAVNAKFGWDKKSLAPMSSPPPTIQTPNSAQSKATPVKTSTGPQPIRGQAPGKPAAAGGVKGAAPQTAQQFNRVAIDSVSSLR